MPASEHMATMVYGVLDAETGDFRFVNAGHPPPLLVDARRAARFLDGANGPPVRVAADRPLRRGHDPARTRVDPPAVHRRARRRPDDPARGGSAAVARRRRRRAGANWRRSAPTSCAASSATRPCDDDVALLAVQLLALEDRLHLRVPAQPGPLAPLRATLRRWLAPGRSDRAGVLRAPHRLR